MTHFWILHKLQCVKLLDLKCLHQQLTMKNLQCPGTWIQRSTS